MSETIKDVVTFLEKQAEPVGVDNAVFVFRNQAQKALWERHLLGQISDGLWENDPKNDYQIFQALPTTWGAKNRNKEPSSLFT